MNARLGFALVLLSLASAAHAQQGVYKCSVNGRAVFQDHPCAAAMNAAQTAAETTPLPVLIARVRVSENAITALHKRYEVDQRFLRQKRQTVADPSRVDAESARLEQTFNTQLAAAQQRRAAARAALRVRCPQGASLTPEQTTCFK